MAISQTKYINIISTVGGEAEASRRELIPRIMTTNVLSAVDTVLEFSNLKSVGEWFGTTSEEYDFASKLFGFVSKRATSLKKVSFTRYTLSAVAPMIIPMASPSALALFTAISDGSFSISIDGVTYAVTGLDFSSAVSLTEVATIVQTGIRANTAGGDMWTLATVEYSTTYNGFVLTGGSEEESIITNATSHTSGTDVSGLLKWNLASAPVVSNGADAETLTEALDRMSNISNNFGSLLFVESLTTEQKTEVSTWIDNQNVMYMYSTPVNASSYADVQTAVNGLDGVGLTYDINSDKAEYMPCALLGAINWDRVNASINFMFQQFDNDTPSVTTDTLSDTLDNLSINYLGTTQQAGKLISFYQRGYLQGDIADMGIYVNEMWLKDALVTEFMNILLALDKMPANTNGKATMSNATQSIVDEAKNNGVILAGKELTNVQKAYIEQITGSDTAWRDVYTNGYWLDINIKTETISGQVNYILDYVLIYSKGDSIRKVEGSNIAI